MVIASQPEGRPVPGSSTPLAHNIDFALILP